jgi:AraC family transcriptional regulator
MIWKLPAGKYYGALVRRRQFPGFAFTESVYSPNLRLPRHSHERAYCCFVLAGAYTEQYDDKIRDCSPSTLVFHPSREEHAERFHEKGGRLFRIEIEPGRLNSIREHTSLSERPAAFRDGRLAFLATHLYQEFCEEDLAAALAMEGLILEMFAVATRSNTRLRAARPPRWLGNVHDLLQERFSESLTLKTIADSVGVHPVHLVRSFRRFYRSTIGDYLRRLRIEFASQQLAGTDAPISAIALASGFADQSHFARTFKRITGVTPARYRAVYRGAQVRPSR